MRASLCCLLLVSSASVASARFLVRANACTSEDLKHRAQLQNKLAGVCVDMCKEVGAFPKCTCPDFVAPDSTPGVMTWPELLEHLDNLSEWGHGQLKAWTQQASQLQTHSAQSEEACVADDLKHRLHVQNKLAGVCVDMCKEVGAFPKCTCPDFVAPDSTPGVMTWPELLEHMDNLSEWGHGQLKAWNGQASQLQVKTSACATADVKNRAQLQNKLAGVCVDMCKEVGAFPKCTCPDFVAPDSTPGVMTWPELLEHLDNLSEWGHGQLKAWTKQASQLQIKGTQSEQACVAADLKHRTHVQNKLAGVCVDMCKEVGAFPKCTCPDFVAPDSTPGVMTWPELLEHMDNLSEWGHGQLKAWNGQASQLQVKTSACAAEDVKNRAQLQNKLAGVCVDMCKEVGAFPKCTCPDFVAPDSTPGVMTWPELLEHLDNLSEWGHGQLKAWTKQASQLQIQGTQSEQACVADDLKHRMHVQNKLAGVCVDMCKEVGAFPKCTCPDFVAPDSTPGVMTWPELLEHMDNLSEWGHGQLKAWSGQASQLQVKSSACVTEDVQKRAQLQNKLAGVCVDMCKEVGAFPKCTCPDFVAPDSTPGVMTWPELLEHLDNLSEWGHGQLKAWTKQASQLQIQGMQSEKACVAEDVKHRMQVQNKLAGVCVDMCKEVGAFPKCTCPDFVAPDSTPGVMTWPELLEHMDNLSEWGHGELKSWSKVAR